MNKNRINYIFIRFLFILNYKVENPFFVEAIASFNNVSASCVNWFVEPTASKYDFCESKV